jgi:histidinol-phosphate aminotransferase
MAGLRVGFTVSSPAIAAVVDKVRPPYNLSSLDQRAAVFLLREARAWCDARAAEVVAERELLGRALAGLGFEVFPSEANLILCRIERDDLWGQLQQRGISVRAFNDPAGPLRHCIRVTVGTPNENHTLIRALEKLLV